MYQTKWPTDEGLWKSALILAKGQHYPEAFEVMKAIADQALQSIGGAIAVSRCVPNRWGSLEDSSKTLQNDTPTSEFPETSG